MLGVAFDSTGNYDAALLVITASFMAAGCIYLLMGRYPRARRERPAVLRDRKRSFRPGGRLIGYLKCRRPILHLPGASPPLHHI